MSAPEAAAKIAAIVPAAPAPITTTRAVLEAASVIDTMKGREGLEDREDREAGLDNRPSWSS